MEPFNARNTVIGQGTVAAEVVTQLSALGKSLDNILVPVGGGGLIAGIASYLADMSPRTAIVGTGTSRSGVDGGGDESGGARHAEGRGPFR